jgi:nucleotide-binding universal stress UspA family protein
MATRVLPYVEVLATLLSARVQLLHVTPAHVQRLRADLVRARTTRRPVVDEVQPESPWMGEQDALGPSAARLRAAGLSVLTSERTGDAAVCIRAVAASLPDVLLALSVSGSGGIGRHAAGRVVEAVIHRINAPVLLIQGAAQQQSSWRVRRILVPLPDRAAGQRVLPVAARLARASGAELLLLRVVTMHGRAGAAASLMEGVVSPALTELAAAVVEADNEALSLAQRLSCEGLPASALAVPGDPAVLIQAAAEKLGADLVVMATHGYGDARPMARCSVADAVLHKCTAPLLLVPPDERN